MCCVCPSNRTALDRGNNQHSKAISIELKVYLSRNVSYKSNMQPILCKARCLSIMDRQSPS